MSKQLAKKEKNEIAKSEKPRGFEEPTNQEDLILPRVKLLQALSPEVQDEGMKQGTIINGLTKQPVSEHFVPIYKRTNWVRFNSRNTKDPSFDSNYEPGAFIWSSSDPNDARVVTEGSFGPNGERPLATKFITFLCLFEGDDSPVLLSFSNTSLRAGRQLLSMASFGGGDMFSKKYKLASYKEVKNNNQYYVLKVTAAGKATDEEYKKASEMWEKFSGKEIDHSPSDPNEGSVPF